jgi:hypothetical protein
MTQWKYVRAVLLGEACHGRRRLSNLAADEPSPSVGGYRVTVVSCHGSAELHGSEQVGAGPRFVL